MKIYTKIKKQLISVDNINFSYAAETPVFTNFSLQIKKGALFGLLAPNGAGKTTLIKLITGINAPDKGQILIDGKKYATARNRILNKIAIVPQEYAFYSQFTAYENLRFFSRLYRHTDSDTKIKQALQLTHLEDHQHRIAKHFSGGLKRRLNFAIGLVNEPELLILDEPTVGIDAQSRQFILQAIVDINKRGITVLFTSHYIDEVQKICDTVSIMDQGQILSIGKIDQLLGSKANVSVTFNDTLEESKINPILVKYFNPGSLTVNAQLISGEIMTPDTFPQLISELTEQGYEIDTLQYGQQTLESLYFELVDRNHLSGNT